MVQCSGECIVGLMFCCICVEFWCRVFYYLMEQWIIGRFIMLISIRMFVVCLVILWLLKVCYRVMILVQRNSSISFEVRCVFYIYQVFYIGLFYVVLVISVMKVYIVFIGVIVVMVRLVIFICQISLVNVVIVIVVQIFIDQMVVGICRYIMWQFFFCWQFVGVKLKFWIQLVVSVMMLVVVSYGMSLL